MPIEYRIQGGALVAIPVGWPDACRLKFTPTDQMTEAAIKAEIKAHDEGQNALHKAFCTNVDCPARR